MFSQQIRSFLNSRGWDLRVHRPFYELVARRDFNLVFDVGANRGQFGLTLRSHHYQNRIVSFEPGMAAFEALEAVSRNDALWTVHKVALGTEEGELDFHVYGSDDFSSFKTLIGNRVQESETTRVPVRRLDGIAGEWLAQDSKVLLKIDTQGFEKEVLSGSEKVLPRIDGIIMETSLTPLYEGQWLMEEAFALLRTRGFYPHTMRRGHFEGDRDMEYDVLFLREGSSSG